jgi:hypothetical protein
MSWVIYTLEDPNGGGVRYVGMTHQRVKARLSRHLTLARAGKRYHLTNWLRTLLSAGVEPLLKVIDSGVGDGWGSTERKWIQWHREQGYHLTNATDGGEGATGHTVSAEARERIATAHRGKPLSAEHRAKVREGNLGKKMSPEAIAKTALFWRGRKHSAETKKKISVAMKGRKGWKPTPETIAKRSVSIRAALSSEEWVDPRKGRARSPETRAKISAAKKGREHTPETRAKISASKRARDLLSRCRS